MFAAMAFYLLKIHKVIQIMPENTERRKLLTRCARECYANRPFARTAVLAKKAKCWKAASNASSGAKSKFPGKKKSFQPMLFARLARRTREHQPERIACLGIESSWSRTHDRLLRRDAHRFPFRELHCPVMPDFPAFPADFYVFDGGQRNGKAAISNRAVRQVLDTLTKAVVPFANAGIC